IVGAVSSITVSHTTGSGPNRLMLVGLTITNDNQPVGGPRRMITSLTFGGTPLTEVTTVSIDDDARVSIYRLISPAASTTADVVAERAQAHYAARTSFTETPEHPRCASRFVLKPASTHGG